MKYANPGPNSWAQLYKTTVLPYYSFGGLGLGRGRGGLQMITGSENRFDKYFATVHAGENEANLLAQSSYTAVHTNLCGRRKF